MKNSLKRDKSTIAVEEKARLAAELVIAKAEKAKRADELLIANKELTYQNLEKEKRAAELIIANKELVFQNSEKEKRAGELLIANKELEQQLQLNADKDLFISILAHDLRGPFTAFLGLSEILKDDVRKLSIDKIEEIAINLNKSALNTYNLLEDILTWTKLHQGRIPFNPQILNFKEICNDVINILSPYANAKNITIKKTEEENINLFADRDIIKTVLRNLVSNAIKFTNKNGSIDISAEENPEDIKVLVCDNGVGIKPKDLTKLFDISQIRTTKGTENETGTGLGLLLCKEFIEKHNGKIWVESESGKGSKFSFTLPRII
jgi:signal transduction histidine kinase